MIIFWQLKLFKGFIYCLFYQFIKNTSFQGGTGNDTEQSGPL